MKLLKYCIVLVVLISLMGTAQAWYAEIEDVNGNSLTSNPFTLKYDTPTNMSLLQSGIDDRVVYMTYSSRVSPNDGNFNIVLLRTQSPAIGPNYGALNPFEELDLFTLEIAQAAGTNTYTAYIDVVGRDAQGNPVTSQTAEIDATGSWSFDGEIPEFPTIALPVAAIIGLAFFMQRRKEE